MADSLNPAGLIAVGMTGTELNDDIRGLLDRGVAGVILFARNVTSPEQVAKLCHDLKQHAGRPLLVMVDQEGGPTVRLKDGFTPLPTMRALGRTGDPAIARQVGEIVGRELRTVGIDFALAPVLDVDTNPDNPVIGQRSFSSDPAVVSAMGCALIEGIQSQGVAACGKHFPGHGDTAQDSHYTLPRLPHALDRLDAMELLPFRAASKCGVAAIMSAHIVFEAIDPDRPATVSRAVLEGVLRERVGFDGVVTSDCMEMKAIADPENLGGDEPPMRHTPAAALAGIAAGLDIALISHSTTIAHAAIDLIGKALEDGTLSADRAAQARGRVERMVERYARGPEAGDLSALNTPAANAVTAPIIDADNTSRLDPTAAFGRGQARIASHRRMGPRMKRIARFFLDGLLAVLPLAVTIYILAWLFRTLESVLGGAMRWLLPEDVYLPGMGIALGVVVIFTLGLLLRLWLFQKLVGLVDAVFDRVPLVKSIYSAVKDLTQLFRGSGAGQGKRVVMVDMPGGAGSLIGFVTRDQFGDLPDGIGEQGKVAVYLPMSYQLGGYMLVVEKDRVRGVDMPVEDALRFALTAGAGDKDDNQKPAQQSDTDAEPAHDSADDSA